MASESARESIRRPVRNRDAPLLRPRAGPFQVVAAATVGYERRRWSGTSVRPRMRWNQEGARRDPGGETWRTHAFILDRVTDTAARHHTCAAAAPWFRWTFFFFFKSSLHLVHTRGPISSSIHCRFIHVIYGGRDIYIYERWDGKTVLGSKRWIIKSFSDFSRMDLDRSLDEIPKIAFLREGRIFTSGGRMVVSRRCYFDSVSLLLKIF